MRATSTLARELVAEGLRDDRRPRVLAAAAISAQEAFYVEMLAGDTARPCAIMLESYATLEPMGERGYPSTAAALLAHALYAGGRARRGRTLQPRSEDTAAAADDAFSQVLWRSARAKIRARRGELVRPRPSPATPWRSRSDRPPEHPAATRSPTWPKCSRSQGGLDAIAALAQAAELRAEGEPHLAGARPRQRTQELAGSA